MEAKTVKPDALKEYLSFLRKDVGIDADRFILLEEEPAVYVDPDVRVKVGSIANLRVKTDFLLEDGMLKKVCLLKPRPTTDLEDVWRSKWKKYVERRKLLEGGEENVQRESCN